MYDLNNFVHPWILSGLKYPSFSNLNIYILGFLEVLCSFMSLLEQTARIKGVYTNVTISTCRLKQNIFNFSTAKKKLKKSSFFLSGQALTPPPS